MTDRYTGGWFYTVDLNSHGEYSTLTLRFTPQDRWYNNMIVEVQWQANTDDDPPDWYGMKIETHTSRVEHLRMAYQVVKRALNVAEQEGPDPSPKEALERLSRLKDYVEAVWDSRLHKHCTLADVPDPSLIRWMDDPAQWPAGCASITYDCLVITHEEAQRAITAQFAKDGQFDRMQEFVAAGMPVMQDRWGDGPPDTTPGLVKIESHPTR